MPRYFFHLADASIVLRDDVGEEFATAEQASGFALRIAWEVGRNRPEDMRTGKEILVMDTARVVVFRTPLRADDL
jgi:hypothetical protein